MLEKKGNKMKLRTATLMTLSSPRVHSQRALAFSLRRNVQFDFADTSTQ